MLRLHKYTERQIDNIHIFMNQISNYDNNYIINWINQNGIIYEIIIHIFIK